MNVSKKARKALPYPIILSAFNLILSLFGMVLLVRYLSSSEYGVLALLMGLSGLINVIFAFGYDHFITRFVPSNDCKSDINQKFWAILARKTASAVLISLILILTSGFFAEKAGVVEFVPHFKIYQLAIVGQICSIYFSRVFNALFLQKYVLISNVVFQLARIFMINIGIYLGKPFVFFVISFSAVAALRVFIEALLFTRNYGLPKLSKRFFRIEEDKTEKSYRRLSYFTGIGTGC